jgi:hypothetical protein
MGTGMDIVVVCCMFVLSCAESPSCIHFFLPFRLETPAPLLLLFASLSFSFPLPPPIRRPATLSWLWL